MDPTCGILAIAECQHHSRESLAKGRPLLTSELQQLISRSLAATKPRILSGRIRWRAGELEPKTCRCGCATELSRRERLPKSQFARKLVGWHNSLVACMLRSSASRHGDLAEIRSGGCVSGCPSGRIVANHIQIRTSVKKIVPVSPELNCKASRCAPFRSQFSAFPSRCFCCLISPSSRLPRSTLRCGLACRWSPFPCSS